MKKNNADPGTGGRKTPVESVSDFFSGIRKKTKWGAAIWLIALLAVGCILLLKPDTAMIILCRLFGALLVFYGLVQIIHFAATGLDSVPGLDLPAGFIGLLLTIVGVHIVRKPDILVAVSATILAVFLIAYGLSALFFLLRFRNRGVQWWLSIVSAILPILVGCVFLFAPFESYRIAVQLAGVALVYAAVVGFLFAMQAERFLGTAEQRVRTVVQDAEDEFGRWSGVDANGKEIVDEETVTVIEPDPQHFDPEA